MIAQLQAPISFIQTRRLSRAGLDRKKFLHLQDRAVNRWLTNSVPKMPEFNEIPNRLCELPVMDKSILMSNFDHYNTEGITANQVRAALTSDCRIGPFSVGASTGTSGNRGLFVISDSERFRWLGSIVAKTISDLLWHKQRVAIILPQDTALYDSANHFRQISLQFFDLKDGPERWRDTLECFDPTVIFAPPKVLRHMAEQGFDRRPIRVFSAAETLDPADRTIIEGAFDLPLGQIYMATEGLLGVTCRHGQLHLAEDSVHFEFEKVGNGLVTPLISSFQRHTQILARYRMNDLLRLDPAPCPCGAPLQVVTEIVGRMDDCFHLPGPDGLVMVTPDVIRNAILMVDPCITDFRVIQTGPHQVTVTLSPSVPKAVAQIAVQRLESLFGRQQLCCEITLDQVPMPLDVTRKLRRVERRVSAGAEK